MNKPSTALTNDIRYHPLDLRSIPAGSPLSCDLYIREGESFVLYRGMAQAFSVSDREKLLANDVPNLWVRSSPSDTTYLPQDLTSILTASDEQVIPLVKAGLLYNSAMNMARQIADGPSHKEILSQAANMVGATAAYLARSQAAFPALLSVMLHDFSVYAHAINVTVYALGLGRTMGITDFVDLRALGLGAMLHDVGKSKVPRAILGKRGRLTPDEWTIIRQHPSWGVEMISAAADIPQIALTVISQHHERLDGSGYPHGLRTAALHTFSSIVAMADTYDALTSDRPYRQARTPYQALAKLKSELIGKLDYDLFLGMVRLLDPSTY